jgi:DNA-directed RNA polymerase subunit N (RpoN/RPB10)
MIIPVKCFTCGKVIGNKYLYYLREVRRMKMNGKSDGSEVGVATASGAAAAAAAAASSSTSAPTPAYVTTSDLGVSYLTKELIMKTPEGHVLDRLGMKKPCCRRHFLTHVDIE